MNMIAELDWQAWYTIVVVLTLFLTLSLTRIRTDMAFLCSMVALLSDNMYIGSSISEACNDAGVQFDAGKFVSISRFDGLIVSPVEPDEPIMGSDHIHHAAGISVLTCVHLLHYSK